VTGQSVSTIDSRKSKERSHPINDNSVIRDSRTSSGSGVIRDRSVSSRRPGLKSVNKDPSTGVRRRNPVGAAAKGRTEMTSEDGDGKDNPNIAIVQ
jgi:hypothetical protein